MLYFLLLQIQRSSLHHYPQRAEMEVSIFEFDEYQAEDAVEKVGDEGTLDSPTTRRH